MSWKLSVGIAGLSLLGAACIPPDPDPTVASIRGDGEFTLIMDEFSFLPSHIEVDAGSTVKVTVVNEGAIDHELMIGRHALPMGGYDEDLLAVMLGDGDPGTLVESSLAAAGEHDETNSDGHHDGDSTATSVHDETNSDGHHDGDSTTTDRDRAGTDDSVPTTTTDHHDDGDGMTDHHDDAEADGHHGEDGAAHSGAHVTVPPGGSVEIVLRVPRDAAGEWQIGCFLEGHYENGMLGTMRVRSASA